MALLHIYDADTPAIVNTADYRVTQGTKMKLGITNNGKTLIPSLDALVTVRQTFDRILFETHGSSGLIAFGSGCVDTIWIKTYMMGRGYEKICTANARIYFNGCNVAQDPDGKTFLQNMAEVFLKVGGGTVFAHTSLGYELPIWSFLTGHVVHLSGDLVTVHVSPGGATTITSE